MLNRQRINNFNNRINPLYNDWKTLEYWLRFIDYPLIALVAVLSMGRRSSINKFNEKYNKIHQYRLNYLQNEKERKKKKLKKLYKEEYYYNFNGAKIPLLPDTRYEDVLLTTVYDDVFKVLCEYADNYNWELIDKLERKLPEGTYCYEGKYGEAIMVEPGGVVVDAGAWVGDFSAYASYKGATAYAFEPTPETLEVLHKTAELNPNINVVPMGLGAKKETVYIKEDTINSGSNRIDDSGEIAIKITTLDEWATENKVERINFIKADIEGHERYMLMGAKRVLREHEPILSICTYHLPDDPEVLEKIIKDANPKYKVIQRKMKLFAYVEK